MGMVRAMWLVTLAGCYQPSAGVGAPCDQDLACPSGQACLGGRCQLPGTGRPDSADPADLDAAPADAALDATPAAWSAPTAIPGVNTGSSEGDPTMTANRLMIVFARAGDLFLGTRPSVTDPFTVTPLTVLNSGNDEASPELGADGTTLHFTSDRITAGSGDVYVSMRIGGSFAPPARVVALSSSSDDGDLAISPDGLTAIIARSNTFYRATRATPTGPWSAPVSLGIDFGSGEAAPSLTAAGDLYFHADATRDLYVARKSGTTFAPPVPVDELNTTSRDAAPFVSADERFLWYERAGELVESRR